MEITEILEQLRAEVAKLAARVDALEGKPAAPPVKAAAPAPAPVQAVTAEPAAEAIPEDVLAAISAVIGAYLGERVHIRQIRLLASPAWAQQGRVYIQASHRLH